MTFKAVISDTMMKSYVASIDIYDENGDFIEGTYVIEIEDKRKQKEK